MDEHRVLIMQYEKLISMYGLHHKRWIDHWKVYLTILAILTAILATLFKIMNDQPEKNTETSLIILISVIGILSSISGWISLIRIRNDANLTFFHLRKLEAEFEKAQIKFIPMIKNGQKFFKNGQMEDLHFELKFLRHIKLIHLVSVVFLSFTVFYVFLLFRI